MHPRNLTYSRPIQVAVVISFILFSTFGAWLTTLPMRDAELDAARREAQLTAIGLGEQFSAVTRSATASVNAITRFLEASGGPDSLPRRVVQDVLVREADDEIGTQALFVVDAKGVLIASTGAKAAPGQSGVGRAPVDYHLFNPDDRGVRMSTPYFSTLTQNWVLPVSRGVFSSDGRLLGSVIASINLSHMKKVYASMAGLRDANFTVANSEGRVLLRHPFLQEAMDEDLSKHIPIREMLRQPGSIESVGRFDGVRRIYSYRRLNNLDALMLVGYPRDDVLAHWHTLAWERTVATFVCLSVLAIFGAIWIRLSRRQDSFARTLEARVRERTRELAVENEHLQALSISASHELKTPLNQLRGYLDSGVSAVTDSGRQLVGRVSDCAVKMEAFADDLRALSMASRNDVVTRTDCDLGWLASSVVRGLQSSDRSRQVEIAIESDMYATADHRLVQVVLANLLGNAWKFTARSTDARIEVGHRVGVWETVYFVRDNGAGFEPEQAKNLFKPFHRLHSAGEFEGNGIGLAAAARIVKRHGGRIWAEGKPGEGATFSFTLQPTVCPYTPRSNVAARQAPPAFAIETASA